MWIVFKKGPVNGPEVRIVLIFGESQLDVVHQLVDLRVEFHSEERHDLLIDYLDSKLSFIFIFYKSFLTLKPLPSLKLKDQT